MQEMMKSNATFKQSMGITTSGVSPCEPTGMRNIKD